MPAGLRGEPAGSLSLMTDCFYVADDDAFAPTEWTRGPWGPASQHAGPPAALIGRAIEQTHTSRMQVARLTFEILKPMPLIPLRVATEILRPGKRVQLTQAFLRAGDTDLMRCLAWSVRTTQLDIEGEGEQPPDRPEDSREVRGFPVPYHPNYIDGMEWRFTAGSFVERGPAAAWIRMRHPLVESEEPSPLQRVLCAVDSASGISSALDWSRWVFINPDLSVHLHRMPVDEWVRLDADTQLERHGIGMARSTISDSRGRLGASMQTLFLDTRSPSPVT
jgi:hypothetical protein